MQTLISRMRSSFQPTPQLSAGAFLKNQVSWPEILLIALFATLLYLRLFGAHTLNPLNVHWMLHGDPAQHYLGWAFFRNEEWHWPPGRIERFGLPIGASIAFTDAIPLLALPLKLVSDWLPAEFQYFGIWMLGCFLLNGYFGLRLVARFTEHRALRLAAALFFILSPPLLLRGYGHESLMAHWLLLASIEASLEFWSARRWLLLSVFAALCHPYLLLMVLALAGAGAYVAWRIDCSHRFSTLLVHGIITALVVAALMALAGYFGSNGQLAAEGYGFYSMNVLSLVDPLLGWSRLIQQRPIHPDYAAFGNFGQYEGFLYLGAGMILLASMALGLVLAVPRDANATLATRAHRAWPLIGIALLFWVLALSNRVMFSNVHLFTLPLPDPVHHALSIFRASGRFGWIAFYLLNLAILSVIIQCLPPRTALAVLLAALAIQFGDQSAKYREFRAFIDTRVAWQSPLRASDWDALAARAQRLIIVPPHPPMETFYLPFADLAARYRLETNAAYIARDSLGAAAAFGENVATRLTRGDYDAQTLYIFAQPENAARIAPNLKNQLLTLNGYTILPPGLMEAVPTAAANGLALN